MRSFVHTAPSLILKVSHDQGASEKIIGYATDLSYNVIQGQKLNFGVDSAFPQEIAQGSAQSFVRGTLTVFLPKGTTMEAAGLVPYRQDELGDSAAARSKYMGIRLYDRDTTQLVVSLDYVKIGSYSVTVASRQVVRVSLSFDAIYATPGPSV